MKHVSIGILALLGASLISSLAPLRAFSAEDPPDTVLVTGTVVDKKGAPLSGKTICFLTPNKEGHLVAVSRVDASGELSFPKAKTNAQGLFSKRVERFDPLTVALCRVGEDLLVRDTKPLKTFSTADKAKKRFDLGKLEVE